ncbi:metallophosphoesterase [Vagococcus fluvialis]|uniref:metallophosphoesterase n=1 Tax=Vagococcus fluvialis TaxID=2738 RepID=UPI001A908405|nr:metallophosphoesterase [Vagococcus fluvialis]MBO0437328.1 metallophosphoesterase [Vagococcus fluvialis]
MKIFKTITVASLLLGSALFLEGYRENRQLDKSYYEINSLNATKQKEDIKIAHISDTQFPRLRVEKNKILNALTNEKPDLIFFTGDTIDRTEDITKSEFPLFLKKLTEIAPTYVVSGNHETSHPDYKKWLSIVKQSNATYLENEALEVKVNHQMVNIIGLKESSTSIPTSEKDKLNPKLETFVLAHHPEKIDKYSKELAPFNFTVFSGHAHGGQIVLPLVGGVLSPNQGFFPEYTDGVYQYEKNQLIVSRGLANSSFPSRINNYPHLIFATFSTK